MMHQNKAPLNKSKTMLRASLGVLLLLLLNGCQQSFFVKQQQFDDLSQQLQKQTTQLQSLETQLKKQEENQKEQQEFISKQLQNDLKTYHRYQTQKLQNIQHGVQAQNSGKPTPVLESTIANIGKNKLVVGEIEDIFLNNPGKVYSARVDSGAETSSIDARNVEHFERDGKQWVRFNMPLPEKQQTKEKTTISVEHEVNRYVRIIQSNKEKAERRAVIMMQFSIGEHYQEAEFTLSDRNHLSYPVLVGRNILRDVMLVDVAQKNITTVPANLVEKPEPKNHEE